MVVFDSKSVISDSLFGCICAYERLANEYRPYHFFANHGFYSQTSIQSMCPSPSRQLPSADIFVFRSIPVHGFRTTGLQRITPRHRDLFAGDEAKTIPCGLSRPDCQEYTGRRQRKTSVADLCRLRTDTHRQSQNVIHQRQFRHRPQTGRIRTRFDNHRFMSVAVSMGKISQTQGRRQGAYADGLKGIYTHIYLHYRRKSPRCQFPRRTAHRTGCVLHYGSRLHRLCTTIHFYREHGFLCDASQNQYLLRTHQLSLGGQNHRSTTIPTPTNGCSF